MSFRVLTITNEVILLRGQMDDKAAALDAQVSSSQVVLKYLYGVNHFHNITKIFIFFIWTLLIFGIRLHLLSHNESIDNDISIATVHLK